MGTYICTVTGVGKILCGEVCDGSFVEDILKMLQSQSELEDGVVDVCALSFVDRGGEAEAQERSSCKARRDLHGVEKKARVKLWK